GDCVAESWPNLVRGKSVVSGGAGIAAIARAGRHGHCGGGSSLSVANGAPGFQKSPFGGRVPAGDSFAFGTASPGTNARVAHLGPGDLRGDGLRAFLRGQF